MRGLCARGCYWCVVDPSRRVSSALPPPPPSPLPPPTLPRRGFDTCFADYASYGGPTAMSVDRVALPIKDSSSPGRIIRVSSHSSAQASESAALCPLHRLAFPSRPWIRKAPRAGLPGQGSQDRAPLQGGESRRGPRVKNSPIDRQGGPMARHPLAPIPVGLRRAAPCLPTYYYGMVCTYPPTSAQGPTHHGRQVGTGGRGALAARVPVSRDVDAFTSGRARSGSRSGPPYPVIVWDWTTHHNISVTPLMDRAASPPKHTTQRLQAHAAHVREAGSSLVLLIKNRASKMSCVHLPCWLLFGVQDFLRVRSSCASFRYS